MSCDLLEITRGSSPTWARRFLRPKMQRQKYFEWILKIRCTLEEVFDGKYSLDYINKSTFTDRDGTVADDPPLHIGGNITKPLTVECDIRFIRESLHKLYKHYDVAMDMDDLLLRTDMTSDLVQRYRANELIGFSSFKTFTRIYTGTLRRWHDLTKSHVANILLYLHDAIAMVLSFTADPLLKDTLLLEFDRFYSAQTSKIDETIEDIFADESIPFTMNALYYDNIVEIRNATEKKQMEDLVNQFQITGITYVPKTTVMDAKQYEQLAVEDLENQLNSYCEVARTRIVDTVLMQTIERHLVKRIGRYFEMLILVDDNTISSRLIDSSMKKRLREELKEKVAVLKKSLQEL